MHTPCILLEMEDIGLAFLYETPRQCILDLVSHHRMACAINSANYRWPVIKHGGSERSTFNIRHLNPISNLLSELIVGDRE